MLTRKVIRIAAGNMREAVPWTAIFEPSDYTLESIESRIAGFDFGCVVLTPNDVTVSRGKRQQSPRDTLLLELGMIIGAHGRKRSFAICTRDQKTKLPTDLAGFNLLTYIPPTSGSLESALGQPASICGRRSNELDHVRQLSLSTN